jgi:hypothetical protein
MNLDLPVDLSGLVSLRERLQSFLADYEEKVAQARTQLHHVEALLTHFPNSIKVSAPIKEKRTRTPKAVAPAPALEVEVSQPKRVRRTKDNSLGFVAPYQGKTLTEAVLQVMEANRGKCVDADGVVRTLYGDVTGEKLALAKDRITKNLSKGKLDGLWERVPEQLGYYTIALADLPSNLADLALPKKTRGGRTKKQSAEAVITTPKRGTRRRKEVEAEDNKVKVRRPRNPLGALKMRNPYQGSTMMDAIQKVLQERKGEFVNADAVVKALYGDLPNDTFRVVKDRVTKSLSKGKIDGLWERVPERSGFYTLTMSAVMA